jgi:hypothetical protein
MAFESVQIVSTRNGATAVTGFRQDLLAGETVGLSLTSTVGVTSVLWELLGRPEFSAAGGAGPEPVVLATATTSSFVVDSDSGAVHKDGTYLVRATINPGSPGQVRKTCAVARLSGLTIPGPSGALPLRKPGGFEALEDTSNPNCRQGYAAPENRWHEIVRAIALGGGVVETLAGAYAVGVGAVDQTLLLNDGNGGGVVIDGSSGGFTGASALRVNTASGGPLVVDRATGNVGVGIAAPLEELHVKSASPGLRLDRTGGAAISLENITDVLNLINRTGPVTIATFPGTGGMRTDFGVGIGAAGPTAAALAMGAGSAVAVSAASTGRFRYNEVTQQFEVSQNGSAYTALGAGAVALLEADGATTGAVPLNTLAFPATGTVVARLKSRRDFVYLDRTSTATVDNFLYFAALGGVGRWVRMRIVDRFWASQAAFFVDPANTSGTANDDNTGVDGTHQLRSLSEVHLRLWGAQPSLNQTITIAGDLNAGDTVQPYFLTSPDLTFSNFSPHYVGVQRVLYSGTLDLSGGVVARNGATSQPTLIKSSGITTSWTLGDGTTSFLNLVVRRTSDLSTARVVQDMGAKQAWISQPITPAGLPVTWANGDAITVYDVPNLGSNFVSNVGVLQLTDLKVSGRFLVYGGALSLYNCLGDAISEPGSVLYCQNGVSGLVSGASFLVAGGYGSVTGGYHRLIVATGSLRLNTTCTIKGLQVEANGVITAINGGSQGTADMEFNQTGTFGNLNPAINFLGISGGRIINSGYTYGTIGSSNTLVNFQGRGSRLDLAQVPTVTGGAGASQITTTQGTVGTTNVSVLATRQWDDTAGNVVVGPAGTTLNDNRGQTILNLGSAGGIGTSAVNWNDVLGAVGGAAVSLTPGSVVFANASGHLAEDNANIFWDDTNNRLGLGTNAPSTTLDISNTTTGINSTVRVINSSTSTSPTAAQIATANGSHATRLGTMGLNSSAFSAAVPNLTAGMTFLLAVSTLGMYIGSQNTISLQTGATQAERLKILTTGEVQVSSLAAGGLVKAAVGGQLGIAVSGTDFIGPPVGGLTTGSVIFAGASGNIAQDNASFFWDDTSNRLGIGTSTPTHDLTVSRSQNATTGVRVQNLSTATAATAEFIATNSAVSVGLGITSSGWTSLSPEPNLGPSTGYLIAIAGFPLYISAGTTISLQTGAVKAERLKIDVAGNVSLSSLNAGGMVKAAASSGQLSIGVSGTDYLAPATALTTGSVLFAGAGGAVAQDNADFFWDNTLKRLGIGTTTPAFDIAISRTSTTGAGVLVSNPGTGAGSSANFTASNATSTATFGMTGTSISAGVTTPNLGSNMAYLTTTIGPSPALYLGSFGFITMQTGATQSERLRIDASGNVFISALAAGGVVVADPTTGKLGIGSGGGGGGALGMVTTGGSSAFNLGTLASGVLQQVVTSSISAPTVIAVVGGQIPFGNASGSGLLDQDQNLFWDNTHKRLGIGSQIPAVDLAILNNTNGTTGVLITNSSTGANALASFAATNLTAAVTFGMGGPSRVAGGTVPNLGANMAFVTTSIPGPTPTLYLGSHGVITLQTGATQSERLKIDAAGAVSILSLTAGGLVKSAVTTGVLSNATAGTDFLVPAAGPLTAGAVLFGGASGGSVAQDATNLFWNDTNNRLGIGTNVPTTDVDVLDSANGSTQVMVRNAGAGVAALAQFVASNNPGGGIGVAVGVAGTGFTATTNRPLVGPNIPYVVPFFGSSNLYVGAPGTLILATGATEAARLQILASGLVNVSSLSAGGVVQAASSSGQLSVATLAAKELTFGAAAGGTLAQDALLVWDPTNKRLGVGTNAPGTDVTVTNSANQFTTIAVNTTGAGTSAGAQFFASNNSGSGQALAAGITGANLTPFGTVPNLHADTAFVMNNVAGPLYLGSVGDVTLQTGATQAEAMRLLSSGEVVVRNKVVGSTTAAGVLFLQGTTDGAHRGAVVSNDPFGVGRTPGLLGGVPMFAVAGNVSVSSSAGATLDYVAVNTSTVNLTGGANVTTATGFNWVTIQPPVYNTTVSVGAGTVSGIPVPAAATLCVGGPPTITGGGSFNGTLGAVSLWVQGPAVFDQGITFKGNLLEVTGAGGVLIDAVGGNGLTVTSASGPNAGTIEINTGVGVLFTGSSRNFDLNIGSSTCDMRFLGNGTETFRIKGTDATFQCGPAMLEATGAVGGSIVNLPAGASTTPVGYMVVRGPLGQKCVTPLFSVP